MYIKLLYLFIAVSFWCAANLEDLEKSTLIIKNQTTKKQFIVISEKNGSNVNVVQQATLKPDQEITCGIAQSASCVIAIKRSATSQKPRYLESFKARFRTKKPKVFFILEAKGELGLVPESPRENMLYAKL